MTNQSTIRDEGISHGNRTVRPNLAKIMGTSAAAEGIRPLISPTGDSI